MSAKLKLKAKGIEFEWEGDPEFLKADLPDLIAALLEAVGDRNAAADEDEQEQAGQNPTGTKFTTSHLAARVQPTSGTDLFKVALAKLQLSDGVEPASTKAIHGEMKTAAKYYKPSMRNNLNSIISRLLTQGEINEPSAGHYALSQEAQQKIQAKV